MLLGYRDADRGHILENIVFLELLRRDYRVYIQVTESMLSPETRERELRPLRQIPDNYEKIVLSMDRNFINSYDGAYAARKVRADRGSLCMSSG